VTHASHGLVARSLVHEASSILYATTEATVAINTNTLLIRKGSWEPRPLQKLVGLLGSKCKSFESFSILTQIYIVSELLSNFFLLLFNVCGC
jgi:hypothetical protein